MSIDGIAVATATFDGKKVPVDSNVSVARDGQRFKAFELTIPLQQPGLFGGRSEIKVRIDFDPPVAPSPDTHREEGE